MTASPRAHNLYELKALLEAKGFRAAILQPLQQGKSFGSIAAGFGVMSGTLERMLSEKQKIACYEAIAAARMRR